MKHFSLLILIFFFANNAYSQITTCNYCDGIGNWDTRNCYLNTAPAGTVAFIDDNSFYYSPLIVAGQPTCPLSGSSWDTKNCFVSNIPQNRTGFIYQNKFYLARKCDDPNWPKKRVYIEYVKITEKKDNRLLNGKDDVSWVAENYHNNNCSGTALILPFNQIKKIAKSQVNQALYWNVEITYLNTILLEPNSTIAIVLYEKDNNGSRSWNYNCTETLSYFSNNEPYGTFYIKYGDFVDSQYKEFNLPYGWVKIKAVNN